MSPDERDQQTAVVSDGMAVTPDEPHFTPGAVIGNRYRIVSLLGEGGMGRVYRADDLKLGQKIALKFLPRAIADDPRAFERVRSEVRIGRQITHPNICRIHDIIEAEGQHFISMELVDGEDLESLLHRIGRLPTDKALALARDVAGGLAAAHARGIIHRDLKPANIMIDGEGEARIMDFGLAALSVELQGRREVAGTPPYMAPEQFLGRDVSERTDIYAFGLILYEMITGRKVFDGRTVQEIRDAHSTIKRRPSSLVKDLEPKIEQTILRCIDEDPADRPESMRAILASLGGGDPLREAVEAGQTPSPSLVAAGGDVGSVSPGRAWLLLGGVFVALLVTAAIGARWTLPGMVSDTRSPEAQRDTAAAILTAFGIERPVGIETWYETSSGYLGWLAQNGGIRRDTLATSPPSPLRFVHRSSPRPLVARNRERQVNAFEPAENLEGMSTLILDHKGRLRFFRSVAPERIDQPSGSLDWSVAFDAAGLSLTAFAPTQPIWTPPYGCDLRVAWVGTYPNRNDLPVRVEAASRGDRPVYFHVVEPWDEPRVVRTGWPIGAWVFAIVMFISLVAAIVFARRNLARGRGDRRGAWLAACTLGFLLALTRLAMASHSPDPVQEWWVFVDIVMLTLFRSATIWLCYLAAEPYVRRQWPHMLISTNRLFEGRFRDPMIGRDILLGGFGGAVAAAIVRSQTAIGMLSGAQSVWPINPLAHPSMHSPLGFAWILFGAPALGIIAAMTVLTALVLFRFLFRSYVAAMIVLCGLLGLVFYTGEISAIRIGIEVGAAAVLLWTLHKYGALAFGIAYAYFEAISRGCLTTDFNAWYDLRSMATVAILVVVTAIGFHTSLGGKPALGSLALDEEPA